MSQIHSRRPYPAAASAALCLALCVPVVSSCGRAGQRPPAAEHGSNRLSDSANLESQGRAALRRGDTIRAEQYLSMAIELGAERDRIVPLLISACLEGGRLRAALNYADSHLAQHPRQAALRLLVATIHAGLGQNQAAVSELERLLEYRNDHPEAHYLLAALLKAEKPNAARQHMRSYLDLAPRGRRVPEVLGWLSEIAARTRDAQPQPRLSDASEVRQ